MMKGDRGPFGSVVRAILRSNEVSRPHLAGGGVSKSASLLNAATRVRLHRISRTNQDWMMASCAIFGRSSGHLRRGVRRNVSRETFSLAMRLGELFHVKPSMNTALLVNIRIV